MASPKKMFDRLVEACNGTYDGRESVQIAFVALEDAFGITRTDVYTDKVRDFSASQESLFNDMCRRLAMGEPVQYVTGKACFCGRMFGVSPAVLIPRPETEDLVCLIAGDCAGSEGVKAYDFGTGSGCIAISLALELPGAEVGACDISPDALLMAEANAQRLGAKVAFSRLDMLDLSATEPCGNCDVVVSNPPYVMVKEKAAMSGNVLDHEPHSALFVPDDDPLVFYRALSAWGRRMLKSGGRLYLECNAALAAETAQMLLADGYAEAECRPDRYGRPRMVRARKQ